MVLAVMYLIHDQVEKMIDRIRCVFGDDLKLKCITLWIQA